MKNTGTVLGVVLIVVLVSLVFSGAGMMGLGGFGMMNGYGGMMGGNGMMGGYGNQFGFNPIGAIISFVLWALVIGGIVLLVIWLARNANFATGASSGSTVEILKTRYARGEITKDQFDEMKKVLEV
ncbi:MAG: SHOCT domain-containing protein [Chloroflexi bacterium]|nr:SHOCT domain-containing protein [Chloroflexota bacterium]